MRGLPVNLMFLDAAAVDYRELLGEGPWKVVANLPYQVGTQLVLDWLRMVPAITEMTVMVQLEVAQRMTAQRGSAAYGLPSVVAGLHAELKLLFRVPPHVFYPPPNVESAIIRVIRKEAPGRAETAIELAAAGFGQRRKMLRRSLALIFADAEEALRSAGIDPTKRAEDLSPEDYLRLAEVPR
jgi:16S rRNA (adenine1518-N6/adenine1519-N6)-dimethyltransferase